MVMKALGYFQYQSDFGSDWMLSTVSKANSIDLLEDVKSAVRDPMTRNDVAQLVLNTLESGTVEADTSGVLNGDVNGAFFTMGETKYNFVTSTQKYAKAINKNSSTSNQTDANASIVGLGEKLNQGDLDKDAAYEIRNGTRVLNYQDDFERPANRWEYKTKEIGVYTKDAAYSWTKKVTSKTLYDAVGRNATSYDWTITIDGLETSVAEAGGSGTFGDVLYAHKNDNDACFLTYETSKGGPVQIDSVDVGTAPRPTTASSPRSL